MSRNRILTSNSSDKPKEILIDNVCADLNFLKTYTLKGAKTFFKKYLPNKKEYEIKFKKYPVCFTCSGDENKTFPEDLCPQKGASVYYYRTKYLGSKYRCCLKNDDYDKTNTVNYDQDEIPSENLTCHPDYIDMGSRIKCRSEIGNFCGFNGNIFTNNLCKKYCTSSNCKNIKENICNNPELFKIHKNDCKKFCLENPGFCDNSVPKYCETNNDEQFCSCINSLKDNTINPRCNVKNCMLYGYVTTSLKNSTNDTSCPMVNCQIQVESSGLDVEMKKNILKNICGVNELTIIENEKSNNNKLWFLLIPIIILIFGIISFKIFKHRLK